jgi:hypothetical protein
MLCKPERVEDSKHLDSFIYETNERLGLNTKNMFLEGKFRLFNVGKSTLVYADLKVLFPQFYLWVWLAFFISLFFLGFGWWSVVMFFIGSFGLLWTKFPYFLMFRRGLKKKGFKGGCRLI